jgi:hypothetical protein
MGIAVLDLALGQQRAGIGQLLDDADIGRAFLAIGLDDRLPAEDRQVGAIAAVRLDVIGHRQAVFQAKLIVVIAVAGRGMDKARARVVGDMIAGQHGDVIIPFAVAALDAAKGWARVRPSKVPINGLTSRRRLTPFDLGRAHHASASASASTRLLAGLAVAFSATAMTS